MYQGIVQFYNSWYGFPNTTLLPEPPTNLRVLNAGAGNVSLAWNAPPFDTGDGLLGDPATGYRVYQSTDGKGFDNGVAVTGTSTTVSGPTPGQVHFFRVTATNTGGESFPTETLAVRVHAGGTPPILIVNGFDRIDRFANIVEDDPYDTDDLHRGFLWLMNTYDYVIAHAEAIDAHGRDFDSCSNESVTDGQVILTDYDTVLWILGEESTDDETFSLTEQTRVAAFLAGGGNLFLSGAEIAWDLDNRGSPTDQAFINGQLHADYVGDDSATHSVTAVAGSIFAGNTADPFSFDDGTGGQYDTDFPDRLSPVGTGAEVAMTYVGGTADTAAIQYDGTGTTPGKVVFLGFPFETITSAAARDEIMEDVLNFFTTAVPVELSGLLVR
jgi:hypothetical protein